MNYPNLTPHETEGIIWGLIVIIMLAGFGIRWYMPEKLYLKLEFNCK